MSLHLQNIGDAGAARLVEALKGNTSLRVLSLSSNKISDVGAASLAEALKGNTVLQQLHLYTNQISDLGAASLAEALKANASLRVLSLNSNKISDVGAASLAEALKGNTALQELYLDNNQIRDLGAASLAELLKANTTLHVLSLDNNQISNVGAASLAEALNDNTSLRKLNLHSNQIGDSNEIIKAALKSRLIKKKAAHAKQRASNIAGGVQQRQRFRKAAREDILTFQTTSDELMTEEGSALAESTAVESPLTERTLALKSSTSVSSARLQGCESIGWDTDTGRHPRRVIPQHDTAYNPEESDDHNNLNMRKKLSNFEIKYLTQKDELKRFKAKVLQMENSALKRAKENADLKTMNREQKSELLELESDVLKIALQKENDRVQKENAALQKANERLKRDLASLGPTVVDLSSENSNGGAVPSGRGKNSLAFLHDQTEAMVQVKEEANSQSSCCGERK